MRIYNLDAPNSRKSLTLKNEHYSCAVNMQHFDKSLHLINKVFYDICESLASPSPRGLWFQYPFFSFFFFFLHLKLANAI